jgi:hypothetical protein
MYFGPSFQYSIIPEFHYSHVQLFQHSVDFFHENVIFFGKIFPRFIPPPAYRRQALAGGG